MSRALTPPGTDSTTSGPPAAGLVHHLVRLLLAALVGSLVLIGWTGYRIWDVGHRDEARKADAIVVLGAAQYNGRPSAILTARVAHAVELYKQGLAPFVIVTGGKANGDLTTEAASARTLAIQRGVPPAAIIGEDRGRTTLESLEGVAALMRDHGLATAVFVSDRSHMLRVLRIARDQGIASFGSPTETSPSDSSFLDWFNAGRHEIGGLALYFVFGQTP